MIPTFLTKRKYNKSYETPQDKIRISSNECNQIEENIFSQTHQPTNSFSLLEEHIPDSHGKSNSYSFQPTDSTFSFISQNKFEPISEYNPPPLPSQSDTRIVSKHIHHDEGILFLTFPFSNLTIFALL